MAGSRGVEVLRLRRPPLRCPLRAGALMAMPRALRPSQAVAQSTADTDRLLMRPGSTAIRDNPPRFRRPGDSGPSSSASRIGQNFELPAGLRRRHDRLRLHQRERQAKGKGAPEGEDASAPERRRAGAAAGRVCAHRRRAAASATRTRRRRRPSTAARRQPHRRRRRQPSPPQSGRCAQAAAPARAAVDLRC